VGLVVIWCSIVVAVFLIWLLTIPGIVEAGTMFLYLKKNFMNVLLHLPLSILEPNVSDCLFTYFFGVIENFIS
jgi:hypothetical protein